MKKILILLILAAFLPACFPLPQLEIDATSVSFGEEGGTERITVTSNLNWTATPSASWINIQYTEGGSTLTISATRNTESSERRGTVTLSGGELSRTVSVTQSSAPLQIARLSITGVQTWNAPRLEGNGVSGTISVGSTTVDYQDGLQFELSESKTYAVRIDAHYANTITFSKVEGIEELDLTAF